MPSYLDERERSTQRPDALKGDETPSSPTTLKSGGEAPGVDSPTDVPVMSSLFVDELWGEDTTTAYSSSSTWSSKCTASYLPARSRNVGDLYSWAGSLFGRRHQKRAERRFIKDYEEAVDGIHSQQGIYGVFSGDDPREINKTCGIVLICARSPDVKIQVKAFKFITELFIMFPSKFRSAFGGLLNRRKENRDVFIFSWKRPGVEYSFDWLLWYNLTSRCLTSQQNVFIEAATRTTFDYNGTVDFPRFEGLLSSCSDATDLLLALQFLEKYWVNGGVEISVRTKGINDPALVNLAKGLTIHWAMYFSQPEGTGILFSKSLYLSIEYVYWTILSLRGSYRDELPLAKWEYVFKLHYILRSSWYYKEYGEDFRPELSLSWRDFCHNCLPSPTQEKLRLKLFYLEDVHELSMRKHFPPEVGSNVDLEKGAKRDKICEFSLTFTQLARIANLFVTKIVGLDASCALVPNVWLQTNTTVTVT